MGSDDVRGVPLKRVVFIIPIVLFCLVVVRGIVP